MVNGETSPPSLLTEADLIALMEKHGIGMESIFSSFSEETDRAALTIFGPLGSLLPWALPMCEQIRYCEKTSADNNSGGCN